MLRRCDYHGSWQDERAEHEIMKLLGGSGSATIAGAGVLLLFTYRPE